MENEIKKNDFFEKVKVNAINIASITLSVVAIVLSIIAISGNAHRKEFRPREMNFAYENRMGGQGFNQQPKDTTNPQGGNNQGPRYFAGPKSPSSGQNRSNGNGQRSFKRIGPRSQNGTTPSPNSKETQIPQEPEE